MLIIDCNSVVVAVNFNYNLTGFTVKHFNSNCSILAHNNSWSSINSQVRSMFVDNNYIGSVICCEVVIIFTDWNSNSVVTSNSSVISISAFTNFSSSFTINLNNQISSVACSIYSKCNVMINFNSQVINSNIELRSSLIQDFKFWSCFILAWVVFTIAKVVCSSIVLADRQCDN